MPRKIFYNPETLEIKGMSDGDNSMEFPHVETEIDYHSTQNLGIEVVGGVVQLKIIK